MTDPVSAGRAAAHQAIARAAQATGADFGSLMATARRESAFNANARAATSSAAGMFQFIESTWMDMVRRYGARHGLGELAQRTNDPAARREILDLRFDPEIAARMAGELWRENAAFLRGRLGRDPSESELYAAHVMGPAGAARLIDAAARGQADAAALFPREAAANRSIFYARSGEPRSPAAVLQRLSIETDASAAPQAPAAPPASERQERVLARGEPYAGGALSPALIDALFALALGLETRPQEEDPALRLLREEDA